MLWISYLVNYFWFNLFFFFRAFLLLFQLTIAFLFCLTFSASMPVGEKLPTAVLKVILCGSIPVRAVFLSPGGRAGLEVETSLIFPRRHWPPSAWWLESTRWDRRPKGDTGCEVGLPLHSVAVTHLTGKEQKSWGSAELALLPWVGVFPSTHTRILAPPWGSAAEPPPLGSCQPQTEVRCPAGAGLHDSTPTDLGASSFILLASVLALSSAAPALLWNPSTGR